MAVASLVLVCLAGLSLAAEPVVLHVAVTGDDANDGQTAARPVATLARARDRLRELRAAGKLAGGAVVQVGAGLYSLTETLSFGADDGGRPGAPVIYRGDPTNRPSLVGGPVVTGFQPHRDGILKLDLAAAGLAGATFDQLFFKGRRMVMARAPNVDPDDLHGGVWAHVVEASPLPSKRGFVTSPKELDAGRWAHPTDGRVGVFCNFDWRWNRIPIASVDARRQRIELQRDATYELQIGDRYFVEGLFEELDQPGEWFLDRRAGQLFFWPPEPIDSGPVVLPRVRDLLVLDGAADLRFESFILEACDGNAVTITKSTRCAVAGSVLRNCGGWGAVVQDGAECLVQTCDIHHTGRGGVLISGGDRATLTPARHRVDNCHIHRVGVFEKTYHTAVNLSGVGNAATHNLIHDTPHAGLTLAGNDNLIEYNRIHHTNLESTDTGGIYSCPRDWTQRGNIIRYNEWHHLGGFGKASSWQPVQDGRVRFEYPHFTWGIYMDDPTSGNLIFGNVLYDVPVCGLHNHGGRDNVWENNVLIDCPAFQAGSLSPDWLEWPAIVKRLQQVCQPGSVYFERYPSLRDYTEREPEAMTGLKFRRNLVYWTVEGTRWLRERRGWGDRLPLYQYRLRDQDFARNEFSQNLVCVPDGLSLVVEVTRQPQPGQRLSWAEWQATGMDRDSRLGDPLFEDVARRDFRLKPGSPATELGFQPIPFARIGPYQDPLRPSWPLVEPPGAAGRARPEERFFALPSFEPVPARPQVARGGIPATLAKLAAGQPVRIAYYGGGIHGPGGWRKQFAARLAAEYPKAQITWIDGSVTDAVRGSGFSIYRFRHDVLRHQPDLVLVDFASDDHQTAGPSIQRAVEGAVRQGLRARPELDFLFLYAFRAGYEQAYDQGLTPPAVTAYERLAEHYAIPSINPGLAAVERYRSKAWPTGHVPDAAVDKAYADALWSGFQVVAAGTPGPRSLPEPLRPDHLEGAGLLAITRDMLQGEWRELPPDDPDLKANARHFDTLWLTNQPGSKLVFTFTGTQAELYDLRGPDTGRMKITVDGQVAGIRQNVDRWCYYQRLSATHLVSGLPMGEHTVEVELLPDAPDRREPIEEAKRLNRHTPELFEGVALRIGFIRVIGPVEG